MIAEKIECEIRKLRAALERQNGDLVHVAPQVIETLEAEVERVRGLEHNCTPYIAH